jgi:hypothetical protein
MFSPMTPVPHTAASSDSPELSADLLQAVVAAYGLSTPDTARRLTGGYANDVYLLEGKQRVVLHVKHPPIDVDSLIWEHRLLALLQFQLPGIPAPLQQALRGDGNLEGSAPRDNA